MTTAITDADEYVDKINLKIFRRILEFNLNVKKKENVLIVGDTGYNGNLLSTVLSKAFKAASDDLGFDSRLVLQDYKLKAEQADKDVVQALKALPEKSVILMNTSQKIGKLGNLGLSFRKYCKKHGHRFTSASSLGVIGNDHIKDIISAYDIDYEKISKKAHEIQEIFDNAEELHVTTKAGTDVLFNIKGMKSIVADGIYRNPGEGGNLPGTETYIAPKKDNVEGKIVIDGSMRTRHGTVLLSEPFEMTIRKGVVLAISDTKESELLEETLRWAHQKAKYPWGVRRIAEFGLGLNPKAKIIGCTVIDEKSLGTGHFAIGSNYWFGGSIYAIIHLDQVFKDPIVKADGERINIK